MTEEIAEVVKKYDIRLQPAGKIGVFSPDVKKFTKEELDNFTMFLRVKKPLIVSYLMAEEEKERRMKQSQIENERNAIINNLVPIVPIWTDGEYFQGYIVHGQAAELLVQIGLAHKVSYMTTIPLDTVETLGGSFTYAQALEYMRPMMEAKAAQEKEEARVRHEKFMQAKQTGKPVLLSEEGIECRDPAEECSMDIIYTWAMPSGSIKKDIVHTY